jgi:glucose/arabinose dehydrogenase
MNLLLTSLQLPRRALTPFLFFFSISFLSAQLPSGFIDAKIQGGYTTPMGIIFSKNGTKMFVWEKKGTLWVSNWNGITYVKQSTPVIDISPEVADWRDFGFQSVALDPNFDANGLIYLFYQVDRHHLLYFGTPQYDNNTDEYFNASISRLTRYRLNNANGVFSLDAASRKILLGETKSTGVPLIHESHAGGQIVFGTDGSLLVSTGDNSNFNNIDTGNDPSTYFQQAINDGIMRPTENVGAFRSQMINSLCGKILRLDPSTGDGILSNPYFKSVSPRSAQSRVWALGMRNPYRMSFKTGTGSTNPIAGNPGTLFVADVQWDSREELNILEKGGLNCGWPLYEGLQQATGYYETNTRNPEEVGSPTFVSLLTQTNSPILGTTPSLRRYRNFPPALDWAHSQDIAQYPDFSTGSLVPKTIGSAGALVTGTPFSGNAATSGTYYTGTVFPAAYQNTFFFADYGANWIKAVDLHDNSDHQIHSVLDFAPEAYGKGIVDVEYCPLDQSIFYVNINTGEIQKISYGSSNRPPLAVISADKINGVSPLTVNFSSAGSNDPDGNPITYEWSFGDGTSNSTETNPVHTFSASSIEGFKVTLTVKDNQLLTDSKSLTISVNNTPPSVKITNPVNNSTYPLSQASSYILNSIVTDNNVAGMQYAWQVILRHDNHEHREAVTTAQTPTVVISPVGCNGETYYYYIELTVTDNGGLTAKDSVKIFPDCSTAGLNIKNLVAIPFQNIVRVNWTNPTVAFDEIMVVAKANTGFFTSPSGTNYTANSSFTGNGSIYEGGKVVFRGTTNTVSVYELTNDTKYFFRVFTRKGAVWTGGIETSATPTAVACGGNSQLYCETWNNIGSSVCFEDIPIANPPTTALVKTLTGFEIGGNIGDNYGMRVRGYICAPESGDYAFYLASDNGGILYLSTSNNPAAKRRIAYTPNCGFTYVRQWTKFPEQKSVPINLVAGQQYYIEAIYKEAAGGDHLAVGWQLPSNQNALVAVIPAGFLTAYTPSNLEFDPSQCYKITSRLSNKVVEVAGSSLTIGSAVQQSAFIAGQKNQIWKVQSNDDGSYRMLNFNSSKIADVSGGSLTLGKPIIQWDWSTAGNDNQRWLFTKNTEGYYKILAKHSNLALEVPNSSTLDGVQLQQNTPNGSTAQQWKVEPSYCSASVAALTSLNIFAANGYRDAKKAVITWLSTAHDSKDYFVIEKLNASVFEKLEVVNAKNTTTQETEYYAFTDTEPSESENFYRIALYRDGSKLPQYSEIISLDFSHFKDILLYPNPANQYIDIDLAHVYKRAVTISITDVAGKTVKTHHIDAAPIAPVRMYLESLQNGSYFMRIEAKGKRAEVKSFLILR